MSKPQTRPPLPADAVGFIGRRKDRPERMALFLADGTLSNTFSPDDTLATVRAMLAPAGMTADDAGIVRRVG
jgi:hypothetical protein